MKQYRNTIQILTDVLEKTDEAGIDGINVSQICLKANMSYPRLKSLITNLTGSGLVNKITTDGKNAIVITEKGRVFLEEYKKFDDLANTFGLEL